ncbi:MAG: hypothetical protein B7Y39_08935 [Bdellovibrio sp. 28-41-41]|nr:MAG: hypothetical protein B7Y39_08935 [Bdellovibrio sp. 28-41-41]
MKGFFFIAAVFVGLAAMAQSPQQIIVSMDRQDFQPLQQVNWKILAGSSSMSTSEGLTERSGNGLGIGIERILSDRWSLGAHYTNVRANASAADYNDYYDANGNARRYEYRESVNMVDIYGRFSFINYPVNKWNQIQVGLLGGAIAMDKHDKSTNLIYGAAASYNYDNLIGFELNTKVDLDAQASTSANLIGYF